MPALSEARLHEFEVVSNEPVASAIFRLVMRAPELSRTLRPGQFMNIAVPGDPSQIVRIPLSYSCVDLGAGLVETEFAVVGDGTRRLSSMAAGSVSTVLGPCGNGWGKVDVADPALLVAGGIGITPIVGLARALGSAGVPFDVIVGAQRAERLWGADELRGVGAREVHVTTDDGSSGRKGFTTDVARELLAERRYGMVLTCGPQVMMAGIARIAREAKIPCRVSLERMMTCGFGACSTCNVALARGGYASACVDGPVFDAEEVAW